MNCYLGFFLLILIIILISQIKKKYYDFYIKIIPSQKVIICSSNYNNYKLNHINPQKLTKLRNIKDNDMYISDYLRNFLEMPYDKYFQNIDFSKIKNIEI